VIKPRSIRIKPGREYPNLRLYPVLTKSEEKILEKLVETEPMSAYIMQKKARLTSYNLAHSGLKALESMRLVARVEKGPLKSRPTAKYHDATLNGVLYVVRKKLRPADADQWDKKGITKIARNHESKLPLVFGKWECLKSRGLEQTALTRLKIAAGARHVFEDGAGMFPGRSMIERIYWMFYVLPILSWNDDLCDFDDHVVGGAGFGDSENFSNWKKACKEDEEIRAFVMSAFQNYQNHLESRFRVVKQALQFMRVRG
jgi:hypothetical protein